MNQPSSASPRDPVRDTLARLEDLGCGVPADAVISAWRDTLYTELEERVGARITATCTAAQLERFEELLDAGDEEGCDRWLATEVPAHGRMVLDEMDALVDEAVAWFVRTSSSTEVTR